MAERIRQDPFTPSDSLHRALLVIRIKSGPTIASGQNGLINCSPLCAVCLVRACTTHFTRLACHVNAIASYCHGI